MASKSISRFSRPSGESGMAPRLLRMFSAMCRMSLRFTKQLRFMLFLTPRMVFSSLKAYFETIVLFTVMLRKQQDVK